MRPSVNPLEAGPAAMTGTQHEYIYIYIYRCTSRCYCDGCSKVLLLINMLPEMSWRLRDRGRLCSK